MATRIVASGEVKDRLSTGAYLRLGLIERVRAA